MSKEDFKKFIQDKPYLTDYIDNGKMTWQKFYELYDMYGDNKEIWDKYQKKETKITDYLTKLNLDGIESGLEKASKAIDLIQELTKNNSTESTIEKPTELKNIEKFYGE